MVGNSITPAGIYTIYIMVDGTGMIAMVKQSAILVSCPDMQKRVWATAIHLGYHPLILL